MDIRVIAVDMDGTFLNSHNDYDRKAFKEVFSRLQERGVKFVIASGNQYYQIKTFVADYLDDISIVSENGAYIVEGGRHLKSYILDQEIVRDVIDYIETSVPAAELILCGEESAYILKTMSQKAKQDFAVYYYHLVEVTSFIDLPKDRFLKFSINVPPEKTQEIMMVLKQRIGDKVDAVSSGNGNIDIIGKGIHKAKGINFLLTKWGLTMKNVMAFGDGGNDQEMVKEAAYGVAMANGSDEVKAVADYIAPANDDNGVIKTIREIYKF